MDDFGGEGENSSSQESGDDEDAAEGDDASN
jgi:hypothetical protein